MKGPRNHLRVLRAERRWSQMDTADKAKMSHAKYWRIENGYAVPSPEEREALAVAFGVSDEDVFPAEAKAS